MGAAAAPLDAARSRAFGELVAAAAAPDRRRARHRGLPPARAGRAGAADRCAGPGTSWSRPRDARDAARSTASRARSTTSGRARACCTCCASGSACPGSKNACEQGECGSCTVYLDGVLGLRLPGRGRRRPRAATSSPSRAWRDGDELHPVQQAFVEAGAVQCGFCTPGLIVADARPAGARRRRRPTPRSARRWPATCAAAPATRRSSTRCGWRAERRRPRDRAHRDRRLRDRHGRRRRDRVRRRARRRRGRPDRRGRRRARARGRERRDAAIDGARLPAPRPGWSTPTTTSTSGPPAGCAAGRRCSSGWSTLYPVWARIDERRRARGRARPAWPRWRAPAARPRTDHHYVFPRGGGDLLARRDRGGARARPALPPVPRLDGPRASRQGGLPPDDVVEDRDAILAATEAAIDRYHDPSPGAMLRIARGAVLAVLGHRAS